MSALTASSLLMCIQQCLVVTFWGPLGLELDAQFFVNLCVELPFGLVSLLLSDLF